MMIILKILRKYLKKIVSEKNHENLYLMQPIEKMVKEILLRMD